MRWLVPWLCVTALTCAKVPIFGINASFALADASWFAEEETLFLFYRVDAEQGLGEPSRIEISYVTDAARVDWTPVSELVTVHEHIPVDCGVTTLCGSTSIHVPQEPRDVRLRLQYHVDGELNLPAENLVYNVVGPGDPHVGRSMLVYGVFDESNQRIQWRGRHLFPTLRNERAEALGLRRHFEVTQRTFGTASLETNRNPYAYGADCPDTFMGVELPLVETSERAVFDVEDLPLGASDDSTVCAQATVEDALGSFTTGAVARKNPEIRAAFPVVKSPIRDAVPLRFLLEPCDRTISAEHLVMQRQRLTMQNVPSYCIDDWDRPGFVDGLVVALRDAVEAERSAGRDMVLVIGLHQDEAGVSEAVEEALAQVVPDERHRSSPRVAGAFVFDSTSRGLSRDELKPATLWCPSTISPNQIPDASARTCATAPDDPNIDIGPFTFGTVPILPNRTQYLDFILDFSPEQAGEVTSLSYLAPEFATTSDHVDLGDFGVVTFLNGERIAADSSDGFSYCVQDEPQLFVFRSALIEDPKFQKLLVKACAYGKVDENLCAFADAGVLPIEFLPDWHNSFGERSYELGLFWEFPFLLRMEYEAVFAGSLTAFGLSVPFGLASPAESYFGSAVWLQDEFPLHPAMTQCRRFCDHPTFDSAGVYHVTDPFRTTYATACYLPVYPEPGDSGFPLDP